MKEKQQSLFGHNIFKNHFKHIQKTGRSVYLRNDRLMDKETSSELNIDSIDDKDYALGRIHDQLNGSALRDAVDVSVRRSHGRYFTFKSFNYLANKIDGLRLSKLAEKENFNDYIGKVTKQYFADEQEKRLTSMLDRYKLETYIGNHMVHAYDYAVEKVIADRIDSAKNKDSITNKSIEHKLDSIVDKFYQIYSKEYKGRFDKEYTKDNPTATLSLVGQMLIDWQNIWQGEFPKHGGVDGGTPTDEEVTDWQQTNGFGEFKGKNPKNIKSMKTRLDNKINKEEKIQKEKEGKLATARGASNFESKNDHLVPVFVAPKENLVPFQNSAKLQALFDDIRSLTGSKPAKHGLATSKAWKLQYGHTKVFKEKPKRQVKIRIAVDISGSMGTLRNKFSRLHMAYDISHSIAKNFQDVEIYACSVILGKGDKLTTPYLSKYLGNNLTTIIDQSRKSPSSSKADRYVISLAKIPVNYAFRTSWETGIHGFSRTPLCLPLQHFKNQLQGDYHNSVAILITDDEANGSIPTYKKWDDWCDCYRHSTLLGHELYNIGVRFGVIAIDSQSKSITAPNDCFVRLSTSGESKGIDMEMEKIRALFSWLLSRGV